MDSIEAMQRGWGDAYIFMESNKCDPLQLLQTNINFTLAGRYTVAGIPSHEISYLYPRVLLLCSHTHRYQSKIFTKINMHEWKESVMVCPCNLY